MFRRIVLMTFVLFSVTTVANAGPNDGRSNEFQRLCDGAARGSHDPGPAAAYEDGLCMGFVLGATQFLSFWEHEGLPPIVCLPDAVTNGQAIKIWMKFLKDHPEDLHRAALLTYLAALKIAFPCRTKLPQNKQ